MSESSEHRSESLVESVEVAAPAERVWGVATDLENTASNIKGIITLERLDDGTGFGIGTRWRETRKMFGKEASEEMEVISLEEGRSYTTEALHGKTRYLSSVSVEPISDSSSRLSMAFEAETSGFINQLLSKVMNKLMERNVRKLIREDLDDIAAAATGN